MISALTCLVLSQQFMVAHPQRGIVDPRAEWLYIGKGVRVVHFDLKSDVPSDKNVVKLNNVSGYIVLDERRFTVSVAGFFGTAFASYENGILKRNQENVMWRTSDAEKKEMGVKLDYLAALIVSLNESVNQKFGELIRDLFVRGMVSNKFTLPEPDGVFDQKPYGLTRICEFAGSWRALKRVEWLSRGTGDRTICEFNVLLPKA